MGWIRICIDPELLPGSGTRKIQSWIRIRNKTFRIHNTGYKILALMVMQTVLRRLRRSFLAGARSRSKSVLSLQVQGLRSCLESGSPTVLVLSVEGVVGMMRRGDSRSLASTRLTCRSSFWRSTTAAWCFAHAPVLNSSTPS